MDNTDWLRENFGQTFLCNGKFLAKCRRRRCWTQEEAAKQIGYSVRLIRKAESGKRLKADTIAILADAYTLLNAPVHCLDIVCNPIDIVTRYHEAYKTLEADMIDLNKQLLADDIVLKMGEPGDPIPFVGIFEGHDGFANCWSTFFRTFERPDKSFFRPKLLSLGNDVISVCPEKCVVDKYPHPSTNLVVMHFHITEGKIAFIEDIFDPQIAIDHLSAAQSAGAILPSQSKAFDGKLPSGRVLEDIDFVRFKHFQ